MDAGRWDIIAPVYLSSEGPPVVFLANATRVQAAAEKGTLPPAPVAPAALVPLDWDNDYLMDLLVVGSGGLRFLGRLADGPRSG